MDDSRNDGPKSVRGNLLSTAAVFNFFRGGGVGYVRDLQSRL